jgi:ligand-binding SRPBCC domain-containing protein
MNRKGGLPPTFRISFQTVDRGTYLLSASQILPVPIGKAFSFFEKPEDLFEITPAWLDFSLVKAAVNGATYEGAEFDYTIRWLAMKIKWHAKIVEYLPPEQFTDVQVRGPYALWKHVHTFEAVPDGTSMRDSITYRLPFGFLGKIVHKFIVLKQLREIFSYRAVRIAEWADGALKSE